MPFDCADVTDAQPRLATLVLVGTISAVTPVDRAAAGLDCGRLRCGLCAGRSAAIIPQIQHLQGKGDGVDAAGGVVAAIVEADGWRVALTIANRHRFAVVQGIHQGKRTSVDIAFAGSAAVIAKGAVGHSQRAAVVDATPFGRNVLGKGAVDHRRRAVVVIDATAAVSFIMGKGAVFHRQCAGIVKRPQVGAVAGRGVVVGNRDRVQHQHAIVCQCATIGCCATHHTQMG